MTREEAMEILNNTAFFGRAQDDIDNAIDMAVEALKQEPVIHAKWEKFCNKNGILRYLECSNCGQVSDQILLRYKYCPNCGAKMDKE